MNLNDYVKYFVQINILKTEIEKLRNILKTIENSNDQNYRNSILGEIAKLSVFKDDIEKKILREIKKENKF